MPMPIFAPVDMPFDAGMLDRLREDVGLELLSDIIMVDRVSVTVGGAIVEVADGTAVADCESVVSRPRSFITWLSVVCHLIWITSAKIVLCDTSAVRTVETVALAGNPPVCNVEVEKTSIRSVVNIVAQTLRSIPDALLESVKPLTES